jgi:hypothetical protein
MKVGTFCWILEPGWMKVVLPGLRDQRFLRTLETRFGAAVV